MPGTRPANAVVRLLLATFNSEGLTVVIEPTTLSFFCREKETIVTFSSVEDFCCITMVISSCAPTVTEAFSIPRNEATSTSSGAASISKTPLELAMTPPALPCTWMTAPTRGIPSASMTRPLMVEVLVCADVCELPFAAAYPQRGMQTVPVDNRIMIPMTEKGFFNICFRFRLVRLIHYFPLL